MLFYMKDLLHFVLGVKKSCWYPTPESIYSCNLPVCQWKKCWWIQKADLLFCYKISLISLYWMSFFYLKACMKFCLGSFSVRTHCSWEILQKSWKCVGRNPRLSRAIFFKLIFTVVVVQWEWTLSSSGIQPPFSSWGKLYICFTHSRMLHVVTVLLTQTKNFDRFSTTPHKIPMLLFYHPVHFKHAFSPLLWSGAR